MFDQIEYPACFGPDGSMTGIAAKCDIPAGKLLIDLPESLCVSRKTIFKTELGPLLTRHPEIFDKHKELDLAIIVWAFHERLKGKDSFWYPAFDIINISNLPAFWEENDILEF